MSSNLCLNITIVSKRKSENPNLKSIPEFSFLTILKFTIKTRMSC
jgi:hypothetical protein